MTPRTPITGEEVGRFGHHPDAAIDFCIEVEEVESVAENTRLGLCGFGHEDDRATLDDRIGTALDFRVGGDAPAVAAKAALRQLAAQRGFNLHSVQAYAGQPCPRVLAATAARQQGEGK